MEKLSSRRGIKIGLSIDPTRLFEDDINRREAGKNYRFAMGSIPVKDAYPTNSASSRLILQRPLRILPGNHRCVPPIPRASYFARIGWLS